mgnify:CR=1 FL=1
MHLLFVLEEKRKILFDNARGDFRTGNLFVRQPDHAEQTAVVHDTLELAATLHETGDGLLVLHLLGDDEPAREGIETACRAAVFLRGLGQEQIAGVREERAFVEVPLKAPAQEAQVVPVRFRPVLLLDEEVLLVYDGILRQHLHRLVPSRVDRLVLTII